jgi:hypothetical protein
VADDNNTPSVPDPQPGSAAPPADTGVPATPPAADASAEADKPEDGDGEQPKPKPRGGFQKRIKELTDKVKERDQRIAELSAAKAGNDANAGAAPKREDFASYEDFVEARAEWKAEQTVERKERERAEQASVQAKEERAVTFRDEMENDAAEDATFAKAWATVTADNFPISREVRDFIAESDDPHSLIEWLAGNRAEAAKLYRADSAQVSRALARVEAGIASRPPARTPQAPPPPPTVNGRSTPRVDMVKLAGAKTPDDYIAKRRAELAARA